MIYCFCNFNEIGLFVLNMLMQIVLVETLDSEKFIIKLV